MDDRIVKFFIGAPPAVDTGYNPAGGVPLRTPMVRLVSNAGMPAVRPSVTRQLTLNEVMGLGGPLEVLVNNTKWDVQRANGVMQMGNGEWMYTREARPDFVLDGLGVNYLSEVPGEGETELWEIINLTADAHPIHTHLVQFQLMNRQNLETAKYSAAYAAAFPGGGYDPMTGGAYGSSIWRGI